MLYLSAGWTSEEDALINIILSGSNWMDLTEQGVFPERDMKVYLAYKLLNIKAAGGSLIHKTTAIVMPVTCDCPHIP